MNSKQLNQYRVSYIGQKIKELRLSRKWTQFDLANRASDEFCTVSRSTIGLYEAGSGLFPSLANLYAIADAFGVPVTELLLEEGKVAGTTNEEIIANQYLE